LIMLKNICKILLVLLVAANIISPFFPGKIDIVNALLGIGIAGTAIPNMTGSYKRPTMAFLIAGSVIMLYERQPWGIWISGINSMINIIAIIMVMQLFSIPIWLGGYEESIEYLLIRRMKNERKIFLFTSVLSHLFSSFLLLGGIPVMVSLFGDALKRNVQEYERFFSTAVSRAYAVVIFWAPGAVSVLLVMEATGINWYEIFLPGIAMSIIGLVTSVAMEWSCRLSPAQLASGGMSDEDSRAGFEEGYAWRKIGDIIIVVAGMIVCILAYERIVDTTVSYRIMLAGLTVASLWLLKYHSHPKRTQVMINYWKNDVAKVIDIAGLLVAMSIFAKAIDTVGFLEYFQPLIIRLDNGYGGILLVIIPLVIVVLSVIGLHPFITVVLIGKMLSGLQPDIPALLLAMSLSLGCVTSYLLSPFAGLILTLSSFLNRSPAEISLKWNGVFGIILFMEGILVLYIFKLFVS